MKKILIIISLFFQTSYVFADIIAPAVQYNYENYPYAFHDVSNYRIKLNTLSRYKLKCDCDIAQIFLGDKDNLKILKSEDEEKTLYEAMGPNSVILKTKYETYTYISVYKTDGKTVNIILSVNRENADSLNETNIINVGNCNLEVL